MPQNGEQFYDKAIPNSSKLRFALTANISNAITKCYFFCFIIPICAFVGSSKLFSTNIIETVWKALNDCWNDRIFLQPLFNRFWKLFLQVSWLDSFWSRKCLENSVGKFCWFSL